MEIGKSTGEFISHSLRKPLWDSMGESVYIFTVEHILRLTSKVLWQSLDNSIQWR